MSTPIEVRSLDRLPKDGCLIVPGRLDAHQANQLASSLSGRTITWLVEETATLAEDLQSYLQLSGHQGAAFSKSDESLPDVGKNLEPKIAGNGILIFVPGVTNSRPGTSCRIPSDILRALCQLGLPVAPLEVSVPEETMLAVENPAKLPGAILNFGKSIPRSQATIGRYREALLFAGEETFSSRDFLNGSLAMAVLQGLKKHSGTNSLYDGTDDSELPFEKILGAALALSKEIKLATKKKRVGVILPPGRGGMIANIAVLFANKIPVNLNFTASHDAVRSAIRQADLDRFITADPFVRKVADFPWPPNRDLLFIERILPQIKKKIVKWVLLGKLLPAQVIAKLHGIGKLKGDEEALLLFTSGSSGEPKGVPLTHRNLLANVCQFGRQLDLPHDTRLLGCLPLFHSFGSTATLLFPIIEGLNLVTYPSPLETKRLAELISQHQVSLLLATPTFLRGYMRRIDSDMLSSLKIVVTGAEKLPENLAKSFEDKFGILPMEGYGLTETSPAASVNLPEPAAENGLPVIPSQRFTSVGAPLPGLAVRITNPATDGDNTIDQSGIIWMKGANIFDGYLDRPEVTEEVIDENGWFKSGDVGRIDDEGFLFIEGRLSRFSKIAGEMVPHETVEAAVNRVWNLDNETERKVAIVGIPDDKKGEAIALLSTIAGPAIEQENLDLRYKLLDEGLPALWCPKTIIPVEEIPVLASGKLDIKGCEELLANSYSSLVRFDHFMAEALYGSKGYYTSPRTILGSRGDFTTTPKLTNLLAEKIAAWIESAWQRQGQKLSVIELGPGDGTLACDIRNSLGFLARRKLDYHFVEISPHLSKRQQEKNKGIWHQTLGEALAETQGSALIISNEFFDAFPVRIFNQSCDELYLGPNKEEFWQPCPELPDSSLFEAPPLRFEVADAIHRWFQSDLAKLQKGEILSIDYGGEPGDIYHRRPLGTLRAYAHHMRFQPPEAYQNPGKQDLTFDVNFSDLINWGNEIGLEKVSLTTQAEFLGTDDANGAGGAFKVLYQRKAGLLRDP